MRFGATRALDDVSLVFRAGEVHVIAGANGAGKSTLIKILAGVHTDYDGELLLEGRALRLADPVAARRAGIATIFQELSLVGNLSIADNLTLSSAGASFSRFRRRAASEHAVAALARVGLERDPEALVEELTLSERQLVEIARALAQDASVLIMDEPTSALSEPEVERLFSTLREPLQRGVSIIFISHRRDEVERIAQHISVLCDGRVVLSAPAREVDQETLIRAMIGKPLAAPSERLRSCEEQAVALRVRGLSTSGLGACHAVSFDARVGEIVGVTGLGGSGARSLLAALAGERRANRGEMELFGQPYAPREASEAWRRGVAFLPADRAHSVFPELSLHWNATLSSLARFSRYEWVNRTDELGRARAAGERARLVASDWSLPSRALSGGNQQKLALTRCLLAEPRLLLLDDPSRGVDAASKADIVRLLRELAANGACVLFSSSELDELVTVCDRVLVFFDGRVAAALEEAELRRENVLRFMSGVA